jgi:hypothetical protein
MLVADTHSLYQHDAQLLADTCAQWTQAYNQMICVAEVFDLKDRIAEYEHELQKYKCYDC